MISANIFPIRKNFDIFVVSTPIEKATHMDNRMLEQRSTKIASMAELGCVLRKRRKELGYTQTQVADFLDCSPRLIGEMERGRESVGIQHAIDYANGLGIDLFVHVRGE